MRLLVSIIAMAMTLLGRAEDGERYALLVGVNEYNANSNLAALKYAETDMTQVAKALVDAGFKAENIRLMIQGEITDARFKAQRGSSDQYKPRKQNIQSELNLLLKNKRPEDTIVVAFAGHGLQYRDKDEVYFCPADAKVTDTASLLELTGIIEQLKDSPAGAKLMIADCCRNNPLEEGLRADLGLRVESATRMVAIQPPQSVATLFSCGKGEFAREEKDFNGGVFTHYLVEGLRGKAAQNGVVEIAGLASYVQYNVFEYVRKKYSVSQTPDYKLNLGRPMILARGVKPKTEDATVAVQATETDKENLAKAAAARNYTYVGATRMTESNKFGVSTTVDTELGLGYTWQHNGAERTLSLTAAKMKRSRDNALLMDYYIDKDKALGTTNGVTQAYTDANLPDTFKVARTYLNIPLYKIELDENGQISSRKPLVSQQMLNYLDYMEWSVIDCALTPFNAFMADQDEWTVDAQFGVGYGAAVKGKLKMTKIAGGIGGQAVKISGTCTNPGFKHPATGIVITGIQVKVEGEQTFDPKTKDWIMGSYKFEMLSTTQDTTARGIGQMKLQRQ
jgi:uncharacterized caspase-like protein